MADIDVLTKKFNNAVAAGDSAAASEFKQAIISQQKQSRLIEAQEPKPQSFMDRAKSYAKRTYSDVKGDVSALAKGNIGLRMPSLGEVGKDLLSGAVGGAKGAVAGGAIGGLAGAGTGLLGGPFAEVTVPAGALLGATGGAIRGGISGFASGFAEQEAKNAGLSQGTQDVIGFGVGVHGGGAKGEQLARGIEQKGADIASGISHFASGLTHARLAADKVLPALSEKVQRKILGEGDKAISPFQAQSDFGRRVQSAAGSTPVKSQISALKQAEIQAPNRIQASAERRANIAEKSLAPATNRMETVGNSVQEEMNAAHQAAKFVRDEQALPFKQAYLAKADELVSQGKPFSTSQAFSDLQKSYEARWYKPRPDGTLEKRMSDAQINAEKQILREIKGGDGSNPAGMEAIGNIYREIGDKAYDPLATGYSALKSQIADENKKLLAKHVGKWNPDFKKFNKAYSEASKQHTDKFNEGFLGTATKQSSEIERNQATPTAVLDKLFSDPRHLNDYISTVGDAKAADTAFKYFSNQLRNKTPAAARSFLNANKDMMDKVGLYGHFNNYVQRIKNDEDIIGRLQAKQSKLPAQIVKQTDNIAKQFVLDKKPINVIGDMLSGKGSDYAQSLGLAFGKTQAGQQMVIDAVKASMSQQSKTTLAKKWAEAHEFLKGSSILPNSKLYDLDKQMQSAIRLAQGTRDVVKLNGIQRTILNALNTSFAPYVFKGNDDGFDENGDIKIVTPEQPSQPQDNEPINYGQDE